MRINYITIFFYSKKSIEEFLACKFIEVTRNFILEEEKDNTLKIFFRNLYINLKYVDENKTSSYNRKFKINSPIEYEKTLNNFLKEFSILTDIYIYQKKRSSYICAIRKSPNNLKRKFKLLENDEFLVLEFDRNIQNKVILFDQLGIFVRY